MIRTLALGLLAAAMAMAAWNGARAETIELTRGDWYEVRMVKFKPGKAAEALALARAHFRPADEDIGRRTVPFDLATGAWDHVLYTPIALTGDGYDTVPPRAAWWQALAAREGGMEQARAVFRSFLDMIAESEVEIARLAE